MFDTLKKLIACHGISGSESAVADKIEGLIAPYVDECRRDALGNLIALKKGDGDHKKVMLCAHMDEIGFMVTFVEENGNLRVAPIGGINFAAYSFSHVVLSKGVAGVLVPESGTKAGEITADKCYIDIGAKNRKEAEKKVSIGDAFVVEPSLKRLMGKRVAGRPLDDRIGCAVLIETAKKLADSNCPHDMYYVFSVQEEVGCRGAKPASFEIQPDLAIVCDVTGTGDVPGAKPMAVSIGGGAAIKIKDASVICHTETVGQLIETAKAKKIKHQCEILAYGGTDTSSIQMSGMGCRAAAISIPTRYIHSGVEMADLEDATATVELICEFVKEY